MLREPYSHPCGDTAPDQTKEDESEVGNPWSRHRTHQHEYTSTMNKFSGRSAITHPIIIVSCIGLRMFTSDAFGGIVQLQFRCRSRQTGVVPLSRPSLRWPTENRARGSRRTSLINLPALLPTCECVCLYVPNTSPCRSPSKQPWKNNRQELCKRTNPKKEIAASEELLHEALETASLCYKTACRLRDPGFLAFLLVLFVQNLCDLSDPVSSSGRQRSSLFFAHLGSVLQLQGNIFNLHVYWRVNMIH